MSNMIKAYSVRYDEIAKKTIDTHLRIDKEIKNERNNVLKVINTQESYKEGFVEGLNAVVVEELSQKEESTQKASALLEEVKLEAESILAKAKKEAEQIKNDAYAAAQKQGYEDGMLQIKKELEKLKKEYEEKSQRLHKEYEAMVQTFEPQMAAIIASLVEKITGIMVEDKEEVILYLINKAIKQMDKNDEYTIKVSKEDYEYVSMKKDLILNAIGRDVPLYVNEDSSLKKNQCMIETELRVINCSLDIQLNQLIMDLKLIGGI